MPVFHGEPPVHGKLARTIVRGLDLIIDIVLCKPASVVKSSSIVMSWMVHRLGTRFILLIQESPSVHKSTMFHGSVPSAAAGSREAANLLNSSGSESDVPSPLRGVVGSVDDRAGVHAEGTLNVFVGHPQM